MLHSTVIDVGIGLVFVYLILGLMCTTVNEWIAQCFKTRSSTLRLGIHTMLGGPLARQTRLTKDQVKIDASSLNIPRLLQRLLTPGEKLASALGLDAANMPSAETIAGIDDEAKSMLASRIDDLLGNPNLSALIDVAKVSKPTLDAALKQKGGVRLANFQLLSEAYPEEIGGLIHAFYSHPLIKSLTKPGQHPSYVPSRAFVAAIIDTLAPGGLTGLSFESLTAAIASLPDGDAKRALQALAQNAGNDVEVFKRNVAAWFDDAMDRVSGWYKTKTQIVTAAVAVSITIFANADTVQAARKLFLSPTIRDAIVAEASAESKSSRLPVLSAKQQADIGELTGWSAEFRTFNRMKAERDRQPDPQSDAFPGFNLVSTPSLFFAWLAAIAPVHLLGWFLTAVAVSLGAPFWFDTLNKFMNIRAAGTAPNEKNRDVSKA